MDTLTPEERSERMRRVRNKDTKPELLVRKLVFAMGYRYRLHGRKMPGHPDLVFSGRKKVIFIHGCFWHRHENCHLATTPKSRIEFWTKKFAENVCRDAAATERLEEDGWRGLVVWQCEISNLEKVARKIQGFLGS